MNEEAVETLGQISILVVDDMGSMVSLLTSCIRGLGARNVLTANNGQAAWEILCVRRVHLIVCDWEMPKMSGIDLLKLVRESELHQDIPFLLLTSSTDKAKVTKAMNAGVTDFLVKPFRPKDLDVKILNIMSKVDVNRKGVQP